MQPRQHNPVKFTLEEVNLVKKALMQFETETKEAMFSRQQPIYFDEDAGVHVGPVQDFFKNATDFGILSLSEQLRKKMPNRRSYSKNKVTEIEMPEMVTRFVPFILMAMHYYRSDEGIEDRIRRHREIEEYPEQEIEVWQSYEVNHKLFRQTAKKIEAIDVFK